MIDVASVRFELAATDQPREARVRPRVLSIAERSECTCPELCLRDHDNE